MKPTDPIEDLSETGRWGVWIDVEGFSKLWSAGNLALRGLSKLTSLIYAIGTKVFPDDPDRLFAHQIGDGFYIASDFHETNLDRCASVAVVLMRGMLEAGCVARGSISEGMLADYSGCRPREIRQVTIRDGDNDSVSLGSGLMTLQAVMGQGIINAVMLDKVVATKGALLSIEAAKSMRLSTDFLFRPLTSDADIMAIDWIHSSSPLITEIAVGAGLPSRTSAELTEMLRRYIDDHSLSPNWSEPTLQFAGLT